jgi:hypothetical protein
VALCMPNVFGRQLGLGMVVWGGHQLHVRGADVSRIDLMFPGGLQWWTMVLGKELSLAGEGGVALGNSPLYLNRALADVCGCCALLDHD